MTGQESETLFFLKRVMNNRIVAHLYEQCSNCEHYIEEDEWTGKCGYEDSDEYGEIMDAEDSCCDFEEKEC